MRVARSAVPAGEGRDKGADDGRRRKRERVGEGATRESVPKAMRALARKVMNEEDIFFF
jgi:hypothetical protein